MAITNVSGGPLGTATSFGFTNQVRLQYSSAYFRKKLLWARFAERIRKDFNKTPGETVTIPVFTKMGAAQKNIGEGVRADVDGFGDKQFEGTVLEALKAWGITDYARIRKGSTDQSWETEGLAQAGRVMAEQVDADALAILSESGRAEVTDDLPTTLNLTGHTFTAAKGKDEPRFIALKLNVRVYQDGLTDDFGDRSDEVIYSVMHSRSFTDMLTDQVAGLLKADANSPFNGLKGWKGNLLGKETFMVDNVPAGKKVTVTDSASGSQMYQSYNHVTMKRNPYALLIKKEADLESARDMLGRQDISMIKQWYTFLALHKQIDDEDLRVSRRNYITTEETT